MPMTRAAGGETTPVAVPAWYVATGWLDAAAFAEIAATETEDP